MQLRTEPACPGGVATADAIKSYSLYHKKFSLSFNAEANMAKTKLLSLYIDVFIQLCIKAHGTALCKESYFSCLAQ